jgi:hypothetical protein
MFWKNHTLHINYSSLLASETAVTQSPKSHFVDRVHHIHLTSALRHERTYITYSVPYISHSCDNCARSSSFNIHLTTAMHIILFNDDDDDDSAFQVHTIHTVIMKDLSLELQALHPS